MNQVSHYQELLESCEELWKMLPHGSKVVAAIPYESQGMKTTRVEVTRPGGLNEYYLVKVVDWNAE